MTIDLAELRAKAEAATPGPWTQDGHHMSLIIKCIAERGSPNARYLCGDYINVADAGENWMVDAPFIAAANPAVVLALIDRSEKAEAERTLACDELGAVYREIARLRALLARAGEALGPFHLLAPGEARDWADEDGWTDRAPKNGRICDWFGPTDFRVARTVAAEIEEAIGHE